MPGPGGGGVGLSLVPDMVGSLTCGGTPQIHF